jgi:hypothetical protein
MRRQATALQLPAGYDEGVFLEQFVEHGSLLKVALAGPQALLAPTRSRSRQGRCVAAQRLQFQLSRLDITSKRDPAQGLTSLPEDVVRQRPLPIPGLLGQRLALAGQIVEVTALLRLADLLLDCTFPKRQCFQWAAMCGGRRILLANQLASAWIALASTWISRLSCCWVLISGGAMRIVLFRRRGSTPFWLQRATIRPVTATALS